MRLIWKKYDSEFNPVVAAVGLFAVFAGVYALVLMRHALLQPVVWALAAVPLLAAVIGAITLVREYQLWKLR